MTIPVNRETVNDTTKLMMHRLVSRKIRYDPSLVERARTSHAKIACDYAGRSFVREWNELLELPASELCVRLISRDADMVRLRLTSPFLLAAGIDFTDYRFRLRIGKAARRVAERRISGGSRLPALAM